MKLFLRAFLMLAMLTVVTGGLYPLVVTALARGAFPQRSRGSLIEESGRIVGSALVGQSFGDARYFHGRPSATATPYDARASAGSNLGPTSPMLARQMRERAEDLRSAGIAGPLPADLLTASGSGLDPHVSPAAARAQIARIAEARGLERAQVEALLERRIERRALGLFGEERVNVLLLNLDLDRAGPR